MLITIGWIQDIVVTSFIACAGICLRVCVVCVGGGARERSRPSVCVIPQRTFQVHVVLILLHCMPFVNI
jgi:hypothetical protein